MAETGSQRQIIRLVGVYDADSTIRGELAYWVAARLGRAHCALCEITHGRARERAEWSAGRAGLPVPFDTYHRNDQPATVRSATADIAPCVVAETDAGIVTLLGPADLEACGGSVDQLVEAVETAVIETSLAWPGESST